MVSRNTKKYLIHESSWSCNETKSKRCLACFSAQYYVQHFKKLHYGNKSRTIFGSTFWNLRCERKVMEEQYKNPVRVERKYSQYSKYFVEILKISDNLNLNLKAISDYQL
jgi:hypothetical protein